MEAIKKVIQREVLATDDSWGESLHPVVKQIYAARGITSDNDLSKDLESLLPFSLLKGIEHGAAIIADAIEQQQRILLIGDFDADGATSSAVGIRALKAMGALNIHYLVPNRFDFGYGLTPELVDIAKDWSPDLIITVDNGIANHAGVEAAKKLGIKVVVTDHHLAAETLPDADAIVNPNQPGDTFPSKALAGVGVIFYVMLAVRSVLKQRGYFDTRELPNMANLLDLVALGTVADVVPLDKNNRILVHQGLRRIRAGKCVPGISALLQVAKRNISTLVASDLGFAIGPRLNAAGRMDDMSVGIECLLADDMEAALNIAEQLDALNRERRTVENDMKEQVFADLKKLTFANENLPLGMCLYDEAWHQGVIGILAARVKDKLHRPVIAFANADDKQIKGSARSIAGVHIRDVLAAVDSQHPGLIAKFGGHAMAAGLSIPKEKFSAFKSAFESQLATQLTGGELQGVIESDGMLGASDLTLRFAEVLSDAGPWGQHFLEPVFHGSFKIVSQRMLNGNHLKLVLSTLDDACLIDAIAFNVNAEQWPNHSCERLDIVYRLDINEFRGRRSLQLMIEQLSASKVLATA